MIVRLLRYAASIALLASGAGLMLKSAGSGGQGEAVGLFLLAFGLGGLGILLIAVDCTRVLTFPLQSWVTSLYFPGGKPDKPELSYNLPWHYEKHGRFDEALEAYRRILRQYPRELPAFAGVVRVLERLEEPEEARAWRRKAERYFEAAAIDAAIAKSAAQLIEEKWMALRKRKPVGR